MRARRRAPSRLPQPACLAVAAAGAFLACSGDRFTALSDCAESACAGDAASGGAGHQPGATGGDEAMSGESSAAGSPTTGSGGTANEPQGGAGALGDAGHDGTGRGGLGGTGGLGVSGGPGVLDGFPKTPVLDDFNRAGPELGASWSGRTEEFSLNGQALWCEYCGDAALWSKRFGEQQEVFATFIGFDDDASEINLVLKAQDSASCDLLEVLYSPASAKVRIAHCADGHWVDLEERSLFLAAGDRFGARSYSSGKVEIFVNGQLATSYAVTDFPFTSGRIGVNGVSGDNGLTWDDFGGGNF